MIKEKMKSGIQRKFMTYSVVLLVLSLFLSSIGVWVFIQKNMSAVIIDKYEFMNEKMGRTLDNLFQKTNEITAECIVYEDVQKSLIEDGLADVEKNALSKYFAYIDLENVAEYCYVDNQKNVYTRSYSKRTWEDFQNSGFGNLLGKEYAKTKWIWTEDTLFGTGGSALFVGRYVRSMEYAHEPGMLFLKMDPGFLENIFSENTDDADEAVMGIIDGSGNVCVSCIPEGYLLPKEDLEYIQNLSKKKADGMIVTGCRLRSGVLSAYRQKESGMIIYTLVPNQVLTSGLVRIFEILLGIYIFVLAAAAVFSVYFSKRFSRPIQEISEAMTGFDGNDFSPMKELHTNTELDQIGDSYNKMLVNIENLLEEIKIQEKELRTSELNMLINQINPHFLYNTLDTIYMLARINKEETTMKMIQALSKYLRLSLSKGKDIVTVEDELENVKNYMEIQQIRNTELFHYEIDCNEELKKCEVLKLILQPLVENAIKHGFCDIFEGGLIKITVRAEAESLVYEVYNSGTPMDKEVLSKINGLMEQPLAKMKESFPDKRRGYGVVNIITRLRLKYENQVQFYYEADETGTRCVVKIPAVRN